MISGPKKTVSIVLPMELYEELDALAREASRSLPAYLRQVFKAHLEYMRRVSPPPIVPPRHAGVNRGNRLE